mgnify:CR=1 FL=1
MRQGRPDDLLLELADNASFEQVRMRMGGVHCRSEGREGTRAGLLAAALALSLSDDERDVLPAVALLTGRFGRDLNGRSPP